MTLEELSQCYEDAAVPLRKRMSELRHQITLTDDPEEIWHLNRRIAALTPLLTQMNDLAWLLANYYEIGGADRDSRYGFNGKRKSRRGKAKADDNVDADTQRRINRFAAASFHGFPFQKQVCNSDSRGTGSEQKHCLSDSETSGEKSDENHEVLPVLSQFFGSNPKEK